LESGETREGGMRTVTGESTSDKSKGHRGKKEISGGKVWRKAFPLSIDGCGKTPKGAKEKSPN